MIPGEHEWYTPVFNDMYKWMNTAINSIKDSTTYEDKVAKNNKSTERERETHNSPYYLRWKKTTPCVFSSLTF